MTTLRRIARLLLLAALLAASGASAGQALSQEEIARHGVLIAQRTNGSPYDQVFVYHSFRVFYTREADEPTSPKNLSDANGNGVPDYIESLVYKLETARLLLSDALRLTDPLTGGFFHERGARFIDIHIKDIPKQYGIASGLVYDEQAPLLDGTPYQGKALRLTLHRDLIPKTGTPLHELFHLYQFNYSEFNNPWFSEGLARWSESLIAATPGKEEKLPASQAELAELLGKAHAAGLFWNRLSTLCGNRDGFALPERLSEQAGTINRSRPGTRLIKNVLENSGKQYDLLRNRAKPQTEPGYWPRAEKRSPGNNRYLLQAIREALGQCTSGGNQELDDFIKTIAGDDAGFTP